MSSEVPLEAFKSVDRGKAYPFSRCRGRKSDKKVEGKIVKIQMRQGIENQVSDKKRGECSSRKSRILTMI